MAAYEMHLWLTTSLLLGILIGAAAVQALNAIVKHLRQRRLPLEEESLQKRHARAVPARDGGHFAHQRDLGRASRIEPAGRPGSSHEPVAPQDGRPEVRRLRVLADPGADDTRHDAEEDALPQGRTYSAGGASWRSEGTGVRGTARRSRD